MRIRSYEGSDEQQLLDLWSRTLKRDTISPERFRRMVLLDANWDPEGCRVGLEGEQVVGFALGLTRREPVDGFGLQPELGWITAFFVAPEYQRHGIGAQLIEALLRFFESRKRRQVLVSPYTPNYFFPGVDIDAYPGGV